MFTAIAVAFGAAMIGANYILSGPLMTAAGGKAESTSFKVDSSVGQSIQGKAESASFQTQGGSSNQIQTAVVVLAPSVSDLSEVYAFPNPFKPGAGGLYDASFITFKKLTGQATIKVFNYSGTCITTLEKTDSAVDYFQWDVINSDGDKVASGVYLYIIKNADGQMAKGKFSIIR